MKREEDEKLWDLLGRATEPAAVSPFFARNVLRKIREAQGDSTPRRWYARWLVPAAGIAVVIIAGLALPTQIIRQTHPNPRTDSVVVAEAADTDLMADLDDLMGSDDSNALDESILL
ncbi:MAG TPA: hypothetical protein VH188_12530 [Chthoniobacterales bacterium]|jgi:hypothetical protein|nr:hypothetical protein [Chthoniobacterales bacterium]